MTAPAAAPEPCTTSSNKKQHRSVDLGERRHSPSRPGRTGTTLCGLAGAYDQEAIDYEYSRWGWVNRAPKRTADLPSCSPCERSERKLGARVEPVGGTQ